MAYGDFKDLPRRTIADKIFDSYQHRLATMVYTFFDKKTVSLALSENLPT